MCFILNSHESPAQQKTWRPAGPLTFIVCTGTGNAYDFLARQMAQVLPDYLGKPVIVQNVTGAGGGNGLDALHRVKPDGRTFALLAMDAYISLTVSNPYKWNVKDFSYILSIDAPPWSVCSSKKYPTYKDLLQAKEVRITLSGQMISILPVLLELERNGKKYKVARFKGSAEAYLAVIAGDAEITMGALSAVVLDPIRAGDFRPLWIFADKRSPDLPSTPTHIELGMPKEWSAYRIIRLIAMPPGVPVDIQNGMREALSKSLQDKRTLEWSKKSEIPVNLVPHETFKQRVDFIEGHIKSNLQLYKDFIL